eukprot:6033456-Alexandrium_andersonii.AAC.1
MRSASLRETVLCVAHACVGSSGVKAPYAPANAVAGTPAIECWPCGLTASSARLARLVRIRPRGGISVSMRH